MMVAVLISIALLGFGCQQAPQMKSPEYAAAVAIAAPVAPRAPDPRIPVEAMKYRRMIIKIWQYYFGLDETPATGFAQIHQESRFKATALSPVGAEGLGQFMPSTAAWINGLLPADVRAACHDKMGCPEDPSWAINAMSDFDWRLMKSLSWGIDDDNRWALALSAYNGGEGWINKERRACQAVSACRPDTWWDNIERHCVRSESACQENRGYPRVILRSWKPLYVAWLST